MAVESEEKRVEMDGGSPELAEIDRELEELLKTQFAKVKVIGVGLE
jgi:hypothetical protein